MKSKRTGRFISPARQAELRRLRQQKNNNIITGVFFTLLVIAIVIVFTGKRTLAQSIELYHAVGALEKVETPTIVEDTPVTPKKAPQSNQTTKKAYNYPKGELVDYARAMAKKYNTNGDKLVKTIQCESGFKPDAVNWEDSHRTTKGSHGIAQFSKTTMKEFAKQSGLGYTDPYNPKESIELMAWAFAHSEANHWACFSKIK